jgi:hypothetical protein
VPRFEQDYSRLASQKPRNSRSKALQGTAIALQGVQAINPPSKFCLWDADGSWFGASNCKEAVDYQKLQDLPLCCLSFACGPFVSSCLFLRC